MVAEFHADGRRHGEANSLFSQFCERAQKYSSYLAVNTSDLRYGNKTVKTASWRTKDWCLLLRITWDAKIDRVDTVQTFVV